MKKEIRSVRIFARVSPDLYKRAKAIAAKQQRPLSFLIADGLKKIVERK